MSDITKKIFSIESEGPIRSPESTSSDVIRPVLADKKESKASAKTETVPDFVTREPVKPLSAPPELREADSETGPGAAGWLILGLGLIYLVGAGLYFGLPLLGQSVELLSIAGLGVLLALPVILLFLLWRALRHLKFTGIQNARMSRAIDKLVSPEREVLSRTKTLAGGIQTEIAKVNSSLADTVETLKDVQQSISRETQSLDTAGLQLTNRSEDVGRNLTLQRQALESISGTFDTRMDTLSTQITNTGDTLETICATAEEKLLKASESLQLASGKMDQTVAEGSNRISERVTEIGDISLKLEETTKTLSSDLETSAQTLTDTDQGLTEKTLALQELNTNTQTKIIDLQNTIDQGNHMIAQLQKAAETRESFVQSYYKDLSAGLKQSENETLAAQGKTARMVESNLAQMRSDFAEMESELQALQTKLNDLKTASAEPTTPFPEKQSRLKLEPLDSDFPPVEAPRFAPEPRISSKLRPASTIEAPLNLGMDMEIVSEAQSADTEIAAFEPEVIRRPGDVGPSPSKSKGFGRRSDSSDKSGWRWRDMLGTLDRPDTNIAAPAALGAAVGGVTAAVTSSTGPSDTVDGVSILTNLQLSPSAIVDEGTVIDATQARINSGEIGLVAVVADKLPEAISHLQEKIAASPQLAANLKSYCNQFATVIGNTPPTAPALRTAFGSPNGRAYLLAVTALMR